MCHKLKENIKETEERNFPLSDKEQNKKFFLGILSVDFPEKEFTIENIFNQSFQFFLVWVVG